MYRVLWTLPLWLNACYDPLYGEPLDAGTEETGGGAEPALPAEVEEIFTRTCSGSSCHLGGSSSPELDSHASVVDAPSSVDGLDYVEPGDVDASYLYAKLTGRQREVGGGGNDMPYNADPLSEDDLLTLSTWITDGAPPAE